MLQLLRLKEHGSGNGQRARGLRRGPLARGAHPARSNAQQHESGEDAGPSTSTQSHKGFSASSVMREKRQAELAKLKGRRPRPNAKPELPYPEATTAKSMRPTRGPKKRSLFLGVGATGSSDLQKPSTGHTNSGAAANKPAA